MPLDLDYARRLDSQDPLAHYRGQFVPIEDGLIYLDGNSLGRMPGAAVQRVAEAAEQHWGGRLIRGWSEWYSLPQRLGAKIAKLIGAQEDEVIVCDSTSVDLFKLVCAALQYQAGRTAILTDDLNFPSDVYLLQGIASLLNKGPQVRILGSDSTSVATSAIKDALLPDTALLTLTHTSFKSAFVYDMQAVTQAAHDVGSLMLWDLCHSAGAMPVHLNDCNVDMAVGCTYKYLNGGPGSPAFLYVRRDLQEELLSPIWGWFGERNPFDFGLDYKPAPGINRFLAGTPPILSMVAIEPGVDMLLEAGMDAVREKSIKLTDFLIRLWEQELEPLGVRLRSPRDSAIRGSHVAIAHEEGWRINLALINDMQVIPDFRHPDNIRLGVAPLYTTFQEVYEGVQRIKETIAGKLYQKYSTDRSGIT